MDLHCKSSRQFFFFFLYCPTSFCIGLLYTYIFEMYKHRQGQAIIPGAMLSTLCTECVGPLMTLANQYR